MKVMLPDWKSAWFENHISDRFFQEMAKIDKGIGMGLDTTGQWMGQIMSETGNLAQALMTLEADEPQDSHIRLAAEKALRIAALSLHLMTVLDSAQRSEGSPGRLTPRNLTPPPGSKLPGGPRVSPLPDKPAPITPANQAKDPPKGVISGQTTPPPVNPLNRLSTSDWMSNRQGGQTTRAASDANSAHSEGSRAPSSAPFPLPDAAPTFEAPPPLLSPFLHRDHKGSLNGEPSEIHQAILSLANQGLSIAEIEAVTDQPRHIVTAILNQA